jgi:hypothetical protein
LNAKLGDLSTDTEDGASFSGSVIWKKIAATFEYFGVKVSQGLVTLKDVVAENFFAKEVKTDKLCIGSTCVTEEQLVQLLQNANTASAGGPTGGRGGSGGGTTGGESGTSTTTDTTSGDTGSGDTSTSTPPVVDDIPTEPEPESESQPEVAPEPTSEPVVETTPQP